MRLWHRLFIEGLFRIINKMVIRRSREIGIFLCDCRIEKCRRSCYDKCRSLVVWDVLLGISELDSYLGLHCSRVML